MLSTRIALTARAVARLLCATGVLTIGAMLTPEDAAGALIDPSDPNILYTGRWQDSQPSQPWTFHQGASMIANFQGTSLDVTMNTVADNYFRVIIDDDAESSVKVPIPSGVPFTLASGLADTTHKIELVKETDYNRATLLGFELDAGKSLAASPPRPPRRIVFYGDSNLAGLSLESEKDDYGRQFRGSYYGYAGVVSRMFDAEYHNISISGARISSIIDVYDRIDWREENPAWTFGEFLPQLVVVNIGDNDAENSAAVNKPKYHTLLDDLRADYPSAHVMLYNPYGWDTSEPANYIHEVIAERDDPNMSSAIFPFVFEQFHGSETDHAGMAQHLANHVVSTLGWTAGPLGVATGYGENGNVGNGSFEEIANFGGWGWRYFDDAGVTRVHDPGGAYDGEYYLRLSDGASSQQTNPAKDGDLVDVSVWLRGAQNGDEVDITIDFRDQAAGADPGAPTLLSFTETKTLTTNWVNYTMSRTAPMSPDNPVFATRLTFEAAPGDTVDIDAVFVPEPTGLVLLSLSGVLLFSGLGGLRRALGLPPFYVPA